MANRRTLKKQIQVELDKPNDGDSIDRAICEALRHLRGEQFWFNQDRLSLTTVAEQWEYDLPDDFVRLHSDLYFQRSGSETTRRALTFRTSPWSEEYKHAGSDPFHIGDWEAGIQYGPPHSFSIYGNKVMLNPIPDTSGDLVVGPYIKDLGTPLYDYDGSAWDFYDPDGVTPLAVDYTNDWFTHGQDVLRTKAVYYLQQNIYRDLEGTQLALGQHLEAVTRLRKRSNALTAGGNMQIRGWL